MIWLFGSVHHPKWKKTLVKLRRLRLVEISGKFDLVITSHLLEDLSDPQAWGNVCRRRRRFNVKLSYKKTNQSQFTFFCLKKSSIHWNPIASMEPSENLQKTCPSLVAGSGSAAPPHSPEWLGSCTIEVLRAATKGDTPWWATSSLDFYHWKDGEGDAGYSKVTIFGKWEQF